MTLAIFLSPLIAADGAGGRTRTDMSLTSPDFESGAYTNFATPASVGEIIRPVALLDK
jgi:hypothetical protein